MIRVGTAGSYRADTPAGSLVVSTAAIRTDGLTKQLVPDGFPAVADSQVAEALYESALAIGEGVVRKGITVTLDVFFNGVEEVPPQGITRQEAMAVMARVMKLAGITNAVNEVEAAAVLSPHQDLEELVRLHLSRVCLENRWSRYSTRHQMAVNARRPTVFYW